MVVLAFRLLCLLHLRGFVCCGVESLCLWVWLGFLVRCSQVFVGSFLWGVCVGCPVLASYLGLILGGALGQIILSESTNFLNIFVGVGWRWSVAADFSFSGL